MKTQLFCPWLTSVPYVFTWVLLSCSAYQVAGLPQTRDGGPSPNASATFHSRGLDLEHVSLSLGKPWRQGSNLKAVESSSWCPQLISMNNNKAVSNSITWSQPTLFFIKKESPEASLPPRSRVYISLLLSGTIILEPFSKVLKGNNGSASSTCFLLPPLLRHIWSVTTISYSYWK